jgi:hypothetical protein
MDITFPLLLATLPLVAYVGTLGIIRASGKTLVTTGARDAAALAVAVSGLVAVGPLELFFPSMSAAIMGPLVWVPLALLYSLCVSLYIIVRPQRLVIYGRSSDQVFDAVLRAAIKIDSSAVGNAETQHISLPTIHVNLRLDGYHGQDPCQVIAFEPNLAPKFWSMLLSSLREEVQQTPASTPRPAFAMLLVAVTVGGFLLWKGIDDRAVVVEGFREWLWR